MQQKFIDFLSFYFIRSLSYRHDCYYSNGGLECPAHPNSYHADAIVTRLRYYCIAASVIGVKRLLSFDGCDGLAQKFEDCNLVRLSCTILSHSN